MAPKPKKMTDADKAELKRLAAGKGARSDGGLTSDQSLELLGLRDMERRSRSYSPKPMTAAAKKKAAAAGKATRAKTKPKSLASKVAGRAKTTAREARDVVTAVGTVVSGRNIPSRNSSRGGGKFAVKDLKTQIKEVGSAIKSGKKGTEAAQVRWGGLERGTVGAGNSDVNVSKKKKPRK
jgi:hypothetical protein